MRAHISKKPQRSGPRKMALYTKLGKRIINTSIEVNGDCCVGNKIIKILARVEGARSTQSYYISDLHADNGESEIWQVIAANAKGR